MQVLALVYVLTNLGVLTLSLDFIAIIVTQVTPLLIILTVLQQSAIQSQDIGCRA